MKNLFLLVLIGTLFTGCMKSLKKDTNYRVIGTAYEISAMQVISKDDPQGKWTYASGDSTEVVYEWTGYRLNTIEVKLNHNEEIGNGTIEVYAGDKRIGYTNGKNPNLIVENWKK